MEHLRFRRIWCASVSLCISVAVSWRVIGFPWPPFCQLWQILVLLWRLFSFFFGCSWARLLVMSLAFLGKLPERIIGALLRSIWTLSLLGGSYSPREIHGLTNRLVQDLLFGKWWFPHPLCHISPWRTAWPSQGTCRTWNTWSSRHRSFFLSSDPIFRLNVLLKFRPSSLPLVSFEGSVVAWHWQRKRDHF